MVVGWLLFGTRPLPPDAWDAEGKQVKLAFGPMMTVVFPLVMIGIGVAVTLAASSISDHSEVYVLLTIMIGGLVGLAGVLGLWSSRAVTWIDALGIRARSAFGKSVAMRWSEIAFVRLSALSGAVVLIDKAGQRIRVSPMVPGFAVLREILEQNVHPAITASAMERLDKLKKRWST